MSHTGAITALSNGNITRTRTAQGTTTNGVYTAGSASTASIVASVQPIGRQGMGGGLEVLPEGRHFNDVRAVYSISDLRAAPIPDRVTIDGEEWEVYSVEKWVALGETFYKALVSRMPVP